MTQVATTGWPDRLLSLADWESLPPDESHQVECSEGVLVVTPKPFPRHQRAMVRLAHDLDEQLPSDLSAVADVEVLLSAAPLTVRAPDVLVTSKAAVATNPPRFETADVRLVVEIVSEGSRRTDHVTKMSEYAEAGIADYWIVELDPPVTLNSYRLGADGHYQPDGEHRGTVGLTACGTNIHLDLNALPRP